MVVPFESVDVTFMCDHSNESYRAVLSCGAVCFRQICKMKFKIFSFVLNLALLGMKGFDNDNPVDLSPFLFIFRGRSLLGYHKRDIALQSSYCMIHFDDIPVLQTLHSDCKYNH